MTVWLIAVVAMLPPLAVACAAGCAGGTGSRLVAAEFAGSLSALMLVLMSFAFDQPSLIDLALAIAVLSLPGTLVFAHFLERWL